MSGDGSTLHAYFLIVTALVEVGAGLLLLLLPSVPLSLLLGVDQAALEALFIARVLEGTPTACAALETALNELTPALTKLTESSSSPASPGS